MTTTQWSLGVLRVSECTTEVMECSCVVCISGRPSEVWDSTIYNSNRVGQSWIIFSLKYPKCNHQQIYKWKIKFQTQEQIQSNSKNQEQIQSNQTQINGY